MKNYTLLSLLGLALFATPASAYTITGFGPGSWGAADTTLGVDGYVIEDFEDTTLAPGLSVQIDAQPAVTTLANTFDPVTDDPFGTAFVGGNWDGQHTLLNSTDNLAGFYGDPNNWRIATFHFAGGASSVGFALHQMGGNSGVHVNGVFLGSVYALAPSMTQGGGNNGYMRIDADNVGETIYSLRIDNTTGGGSPGDAYTFDHLAFAPAVPEPSTYGLGLLALLAFGASRRRR